MNKEELKIFIEKNKDNYSIQLKRWYPVLYKEIENLYTYPKFCQKLFHYIYGNELGKCEICGNICKFDGFHKGYRKRCSYKCMGNSKYTRSHETRGCVICGDIFEIYKNREKTTCSNECLLKLNFSPEVNKKRLNATKMALTKKYGVDHPSKIPGFKEKLKNTKLENHGNENYVNTDKAKNTKLLKYGDEHYINTEKIKQTCMERYGVPNIFHLPQNKTNGKHISNFQKREYEKILKLYPDAKLEEYLPSIQKSVDILIPSLNKIIECFGDYWHCNPSKYQPDYYHKYVHMNAKEIWERDEKRINEIKAAGYDVEIIWENA